MWTITHLAGRHRRAARKGLPYMLEHTDALEQQLEQQLEQHPADQAMVTFHFTDDVFLRPYN